MSMGVEATAGAVRVEGALPVFSSRAPFPVKIFPRPAGLRLRASCWTMSMSPATSREASGETPWGDMHDSHVSGRAK